MKQKLISTAGLVTAIGLFILDCGLSIHNLGCDVFDLMKGRRSVAEGVEDMNGCFGVLVSCGTLF
jgi:hypothetical protein